MKRLYRLYIANISKDDIIQQSQLVGYDVFTIIPCTVVWDYEVEESHVLELISDTIEDGNLKRLVNRLRTIGNEECFYLIETTTIKETLI